MSQPNRVALTSDNALPSLQSANVAAQSFLAFAERVNEVKQALDATQSTRDSHIASLDLRVAHLDLELERLALSLRSYQRGTEGNNGLVVGQMDAGTVNTIPVSASTSYSVAVGVKKMSSDMPRALPAGLATD